MEAVKVSHISKSFKEHRLFHDTSYSFEQGGFYAIVGESGSGKSTLLHMIGGLEPVDAGDILVQGVSVKDKKMQRNLWKMKIAFIFQNYALIEDESVEDNLRIALDSKKGKKDDSKKRIQEALDKVGLQGYEKKQVRVCSGGEKQRIALARVLLKPCELVLADEPTGNLDDKNKEIVFQILKDLQELGKTILMVTHDRSLAERCTEVIYL